MHSLQQKHIQSQANTTSLQSGILSRGMRMQDDTLCTGDWRRLMRVTAKTMFINSLQHILIRYTQYCNILIIYTVKAPLATV